MGNSAAAIGGGGANFSTFVYPPATPAATAPAVPLDANETDEHKVTFTHPCNSSVTNPLVSSANPGYLVFVIVTKSCISTKLITKSNL